MTVELFSESTCTHRFVGVHRRIDHGNTPYISGVLESSHTQNDTRVRSGTFPHLQVPRVGWFDALLYLPTDFYSSRMVYVLIFSAHGAFLVGSPLIWVLEIELVVHRDNKEALEVGERRLETEDVALGTWAVCRCLRSFFGSL